MASTTNGNEIRTNESHAIRERRADLGSIKLTVTASWQINWQTINEICGFQIFVYLRIDYGRRRKSLTFCLIHDVYKKSCNEISYHHHHHHHHHHFSPCRHADTDDCSVVNYLEKRPSFYKRLEIKSCGLHRGFAQGMQKISRVNIVTRISALGVINVYLVG